MSLDPRPRGSHRDPSRHRGRRPARGERTGRVAPEARPEPAEEPRGLAATVAHALRLLQDRRGPLEPGVTRDVVDRLRYFAHEAPDPSLRAAVHVACSYLSAGDLEETQLALSGAAHLLRPGPGPHAGPSA